LPPPLPPLELKLPNRHYSASHPNLKQDFGWVSLRRHILAFFCSIIQAFISLSLLLNMLRRIELKCGSDVLKAAVVCHKYKRHVKFTTRRVYYQSRRSALALQGLERKS
jgi:hypothetical protein